MRLVVRPVEEELVLHRGSTDVGVRVHPALVIACRDRRGRALARDELGAHGRRLVPLAHFAGELARARLADRVHREAAGAVEVDRARPALDDGDLGDVVRRRLRRQRAEERQRDVDAVEVVHVVLAAAARARAARRVRRELHARDQFDEVPVLRAHREILEDVLRQGAVDRRGGLLDVPGLGGDGDRFGHGLDRHRRVDGHILAEQDLRLARHGLHAGKREGHRVVPWRQGRQLVRAAGPGHGHTRAGQHRRTGFDRDARHCGAGLVEHFAADRSGLLGERGHGAKHHQKKQDRSGDA